MKKLETREIVILGAMALVVLGGIGHFLFGDSVNKPANSSVLSPAELTNLTNDITATLSLSILTPGERYVVDRAESEWRGNPFLERPVFNEMARAKTPEAERILFHYSGYLEFNGRVFAIINGMEYSAGESLEEKGYELRQVSPRSVIIENRSTGEKITVLLQE